MISVCGLSGGMKKLITDHLQFCGWFLLSQEPVMYLSGTHSPRAWRRTWGMWSIHRSHLLVRNFSHQHAFNWWLHEFSTKSCFWIAIQNSVSVQFRYRGYMNAFILFAYQSTRQVVSLYLSYEIHIKTTADRSDDEHNSSHGRQVLLSTFFSPIEISSPTVALTTGKYNLWLTFWNIHLDYQSDGCVRECEQLSRWEMKSPW